MRAGWIAAVVLSAGLGGVVGGAVDGTIGSPAAAAQPATVVSPKIPLNVRVGPAVWHARVGALPHGASATLVCQVVGQRVDYGTVRRTDRWNRLPDGTYISDAWVRRAAEPPSCGAPAAAPGPVTPVAAATHPGTVVSPTIALRVRTGPAMSYRQVGQLPHGHALAVVCQSQGQRVNGPMRATDAWNRLADGTFVADAYVRRAGQPPACVGTGGPGVAGAPPAGAWAHPLPGHATPRGSFRAPHIGVDFMSYTGTPIRAAAAGQVLEVVCNIQPGGSCDRPGSASARGCGWYAKIGHAGGLTTLYCHLVRQPAVTVGQQVAAGQVIGYVGSSGNSSYPHLHFEVHTGGLPTGPHNAVDPVPFMQRAGIRISR